MAQAPVPVERRRLLTAALMPLLAALLLWVLFGIEQGYGLDFSSWGILPRHLSGLKGIVTSPFIHGDLEHLANNTFPILVLGWCLVYFYPKDNTPGCTTQACSFRDSYAEFTDAGAVVIGVSGDTSESHKEFAASRNLPFLLVSDRDGELRKAFGVPTTFGIIPGRVTYVIDREGIVRMKFNSQLNPKRHIDEALQMVKQLNRGTEA